MNQRYILMCIALVLPGCVRFQPTRLKTEAITRTEAHAATSSVSATARIIHHDASSPTANDLMNQITMISLSITNKTDSPIHINPALITPAIIRSHDFAQLVPKSYGCYFVPAIVLGSTGLLFLWQVGLPLAGLFTLFGINQSRRAAERTVTSFSEQTLTDTKTIPPHSTHTYILAINLDHYKPDLTLIIKTKNSPEKCSLTFNKTTHQSYKFI